MTSKKEIDAKYYSGHKKEVGERVSRYYKANKEKIAARKKRWYRAKIKKAE